MKFPAPTLTKPSLTTWQFTFNGFIWGNATPSAVLSVSGLGDTPTVRSSNPPRARDHGEWVGLDLYGGRTMTIDVWSRPNNTSLQNELLKLAAALEVGLSTEQPLWFRQPNLPLLCVMCRATKKTVPWDQDYGAAMVAKPVAQLHATSPYVFSAGRSVSVGLPNPTSGLKFPVTFPLTFGATSPNGVTVTNGGNSPVRPVLVISGPVTNPRVANASLPTTPTISLSNPFQGTYTVTAGDQVVIDTDVQSVQYYVGGVTNGSPASRESWIVPGTTWWDLKPGENLVQFLSSDSATSGATVEVQWADSYIL